MADINLPIITLARGPWTAELFDPRPAPALLGSRFVGGGYVRALRREGRLLTGRGSAHWHHFDGMGLPETFESGLGWHLVPDGEEFLRIGAGRLTRRVDLPGERHALQAPTTVLEWSVESSADACVMRTADQLRLSAQGQIGYRLERAVRLLDDGLLSTTTLTIEGRGPNTGSVPLAWFAHPFFAQSRFDGMAVALPPGARLLPNPRRGDGIIHPSAQAGDDGLWRISAEGGRAAFAGMWGSREPITVHPEGGGTLAVALDVPLDHVVLWACACGGSIEPKWSRTWLNGETATWSTRYRWVG